MTVVEGQLLPELVIGEVVADHARLMALLLDDPNPIHLDPAAAAAAGLGDREVLQGGVTFGYVLSMLTGWAGRPSAVTDIECRFLANVLVGDRVTAGGRVTAVVDHTGGRAARCEVWADRGDGTRLVEGRATVTLS